MTLETPNFEQFEPEDPTAVLARAVASLNDTLAQLVRVQTLISEDVTQIRMAVVRRISEEEEEEHYAPLDEDEREQANNLIALIRRERAQQSNVRAFFEELIADSVIDISDFLSRNRHLPYEVSEDEDGNLYSRGLMVAVGRSVAQATGYNAPHSYRMIGYTEDRGGSGQVLASISERVANEVNRII